MNSYMFGFNGKEKPIQMNILSGWTSLIFDCIYGTIEHDETHKDESKQEIINNYNYALNEEFDYLDEDKQQEQEQPEESKE